MLGHHDEGMQPRAVLAVDLEHLLNRDPGQIILAKDGDKVEHGRGGEEADAWFGGIPVVALPGHEQQSIASTPWVGAGPDLRAVVGAEA